MEDTQSNIDSHISDDSLENIENKYYPALEKFDTHPNDDNKAKYNNSLTSKRTLNSSKGSAKVLASIDHYNTQHGLNSQRSTKADSCYEGQGSYGYSKIKNVIDETFHKGYKEKLAELETLKYEYEVLQDKEQAATERVERLEKENKVMNGKYQKLKDMYKTLKDQHCADKGAMKDAQDENVEYTQNIDELEQQVHEALELFKTKEQENKLLLKKIEKLTKNAQEESKHYSELDQKSKKQIDKLEKDKADILHRFKDTQKALHNDIEELSQQVKLAVGEKNYCEGELKKLQKKYKNLKEMNKRLKDQIIQNRINNEELFAENEALRAKIACLREEDPQIPPKDEQMLMTEKDERVDTENARTMTFNDKETQSSFEHNINLLRARYEEENSSDKAQIRSLAYEIRNLQSENEYLTKAIDSVQEEYLEFKKSVQDEKKKSERQSKEPNQDLYFNPQIYLQEIQDLKTQVKELEDQKNKLLYESNKVRYDFGFLEAQMTEFQDAIYRLESQNEKLQRDLESHQNGEIQEENIVLLKEIENKNEEILALRQREKALVQTIKDLELLLEDAKLHQAENEQRNRLTYSHTGLELSETLDTQNLKGDSRNQSHRQHENFQVGEHNDALNTMKESHVDVKEDNMAGNLPLKPSLLTVNYEIERLTEKYQDIKTRYEHLQSPR